MNYGLLSLELCVVLAGLAVLIADLWLPGPQRRALSQGAAGLLGLLLLLSFTRWIDAGEVDTALGGMFIQDDLALFFKRLFLAAAILVLVLTYDYADRLPSATIGEYAALVLFGLAGMMLAASANHLSVLFVSVELITVTFYVLVSFQRARVSSLEAGVKYLVMGAMASALMVYGIALIYGTAQAMDFASLSACCANCAG